LAGSKPEKLQKFVIFDTQKTKFVTCDTWQKFVSFFLEGSTCDADDVSAIEIEMSNGETFFDLCQLFYPNEWPIT
jgi:hypothetical protein